MLTFDDPRRDDFLQLFPTQRRSLVANRFLEVVRDGLADEPAQIVEAVLSKLRLAEVRGWSSASRDRELAQVIASHKEQAQAFADWCLGYEALSDQERDLLKAGRSAGHLASWMDTRCPSEKQLAYLAALGYRGSRPSTMGDASALIDEMVRGGVR